MSMGNFCGTSNAATKLYQGEIISVYRKYFHNNDQNSSFMHGMLKYMAQTGSIEMMEYCTKQNNLSVGDTVTFTFSKDKDALNPYANGVTKYDFNAHHEMKQPPQQNDDYYNKDRNKTTKKSKKENQPRFPVRLICISDTHNSHNKLTKYLSDIYQSESDILIHCGDMTDSGSIQELKAVNKWFGKLPYKHIIITAGNMDGIGLDKEKYGRGGAGGGRYGGFYDKDDENDTNMVENGGKKQSLAHSIFTNAVYLEHESYHLEEFDLRFFASPYSMRFYGGFQINNDKEAAVKWNQVPTNTDILICHGPPFDILDSTSSGKRAGDKVLLNHVVNRIKPKVMCFGHMHSSYGYKQFKGIHFYNCAQDNALNGHHSYSSYYKKHNNMNDVKPHVIDLSQLA